MQSLQFQLLTKSHGVVGRGTFLLAFRDQSWWEAGRKLQVPDQLLSGGEHGNTRKGLGKVRKDAGVVCKKWCRVGRVVSCERRSQGGYGADEGKKLRTGGREMWQGCNRECLPRIQIVIM